MKNVLLLIHDDPGQESRVQAAVDAVRALKGKLTCLDVTEVPDRAFETFGGPIATMVRNQAAANERHNKAALLPRLKSLGLEPMWIDAAEDVATAMIRHGSLADLIVINTPMTGVEFPDMMKLARTLTGGVRAPILAVPCDATEFRPNGPAVLFWDGSSDAEAAMCAAVPLLQLASQVTILQIDTGRPAPPASEAIAYLRTQDVIAHHSGHDTIGAPVRALERYLHKRGPAYAVMGAFGHGRLHDAVFGSITQHLLATSPVPLLIARHP